ncbi:MAG: hypothetical protein ACREAB_11675, partial [Blastocatellia bacterium]
TYREERFSSFWAVPMIFSGIARGENNLITRKGTATSAHQAAQPQYLTDALVLFNSPYAHARTLEAYPGTIFIISGLRRSEPMSPSDMLIARIVGFIPGLFNGNCQAIWG